VNLMLHGALLGALVAGVAAAPAGAQSASQPIRLEIRPINEIAMRGSATFTIPARTATRPDTIKAVASYAITTNEVNRRITVALDQPMPEGVSLQMRMTAPAGAQAGEELTLSTSAQTAVTGISRLNARDLGIDFLLVTGASTVIPTTTSRTVRITLVSGV
jgi:hypothetical protein